MRGIPPAGGRRPVLHTRCKARRVPATRPPSRRTPPTSRRVPARRARPSRRTFAGGERPPLLLRRGHRQRHRWSPPPRTASGSSPPTRFPDPAAHRIRPGRHRHWLWLWYISSTPPCWSMAKPSLSSWGTVAVISKPRWSVQNGRQGSTSFTTMMGVAFFMGFSPWHGSVGVGNRRHEPPQEAPGLVLPKCPGHSRTLAAPH